MLYAQVRTADKFCFASLNTPNPLGSPPAGVYFVLLPDNAPEPCKQWHVSGTTFTTVNPNE